MIRYLLGTKISCRSGRALARAIASLQGAPCRYYQDGQNRSKWRLNRRHVRFGSLLPTCDKELNSQYYVGLASNKEQALDMMRDTGVSIPNMYPIEIAMSDNTLTRIFRKSHRHGANDNPIIVRAGHHAPEEATQYDYCMQYLIKKREYRVHSFCGNVIRVQQKRRKRGVEQNDTIRNLINGWVFCKIQEADYCSLPDGLLDLGVRAVAALGLDFGAADIIQDKHGKLYVLEVNTAPGLTSDDGVAVYANACVAWDRAN